MFQYPFQTLRMNIRWVYIYIPFRFKKNPIILMEFSLF